MAKRAKIKVITNRDRELLTGLARTAIITREQAVEFLGYDNNYRRLSNLVYSGYLKESVAKVGGKFETVYRLDRAGANYVRDNVAEVNHFYKYASVNHDVELTRLYYQEYYEFRESWRTETDYKQERRHIGCPDATICRADGTMVVVEVITRTYSEEQIESKHEFARENQMEVNSYRI